jgi:hypothetical protein
MNQQPYSLLLDEILYVIPDFFNSCDLTCDLLSCLFEIRNYLSIYVLS